MINIALYVPRARGTYRLIRLQFGSGKPSVHTPSVVQGPVDASAKAEKGEKGETSDKGVKDDIETISPRSSSPSPPKSNLPAVEDRKIPSNINTPRVSRSASPHAAVGLGSQATSPVSFGYSYRQPIQNGLFAETHRTAILG